jgi:uncharacterized protein YkwD
MFTRAAKVRGVMTLIAPLCVGALSVFGGSTAVTTSTGAAEGPTTAGTDAARWEVLAPGARAVALAPPTARYAGAINRFSRTAVDTAYRNKWVGTLNVPTGWTGSNSSCQAGTTSSSSRAATLRALNFVRAMNGLAPVTFGSTLNARAQRAALMMSANGALSHTPSTSWRCYTRVGAATAGKSDLALAYPKITSGRVVEMYMDDQGAENTAVGHRRWLLNPFATAMGNGSTDAANALTVIGPSSLRRPNPAWTSWPTSGYFPNTMEPARRWSLSSGSGAMQFGRATVHVYRGGTLLRTHKLPVASGYGRPTIAWDMPATFSRTATYKVVVRGIHHSGSSKVYSHAYYVRLFTPSS